MREALFDGDDGVAGVDAVALAVVMAQPFNPMVLSGAATAQQLGSNAKALTLLERIREDDAAGDAIAGLLAVGKVEPEVYWSERSALSWN